MMAQGSGLTPNGQVGPFSLTRANKAVQLIPELVELTQLHHDACPAYGRMLDSLHPLWREASTFADLPWLPVGVFKNLRLVSVPEEQISRELRSSGTTGSQPSRIYLDRSTAATQTQALAQIVTHFIGTQRRPMLIVDQRDLLRSTAALTARGAAVLGFSNFGRHHTYALTPELSLDRVALHDFLTRFNNVPVLVFGFTFIVWQALVQACEREDVALKFPPDSVLIHGGGWKKMHENRADNASFKHHISETLGINRVFNYYGMAEQVGSIFMECEHGHLHVPDYAQVIIRDPLTLEELPLGKTGLIQVLSRLPRSYPGQSLLTEDLGSVIGEDDCPCRRQGRTLHVVDRLPRAELRGCSDTRTP